MRLRKVRIFDMLSHKNRQNEEHIRIMSAEQLQTHIPVSFCIGDIHGDLGQLELLWLSLEKSVTPDQWSHAHIFFLGDYVDRGIDSKGVIEFLSTLTSSGRAPATQKHFFCAGNHDFAFAAFLGLIDPPNAQMTADVDESDEADDAIIHDFSQTHKHFDRWERENVGNYTGSLHQTMHLQGLRYGLLEIYSSHETFRSYGVEPGDRDALLKVMPAHHKRFLRSMPWVNDVLVKPPAEYPDDIAYRVIAVHSGLTSSSMQTLEQQLEILQKRNTHIHRPIWLSGRDETFDKIPRELVKEPLKFGFLDQSQSSSISNSVSSAHTFVVSGHHHKLFINHEGIDPSSAALSSKSATRIVVDTFGGEVGRSLSAIMLPHCRLITARPDQMDPFDVLEIATKELDDDVVRQKCVLSVDKKC